MLRVLVIFITFTFIFLNSIINYAFSEVVKKIEIKGNERISNETILMFSSILENDDLNKKDINDLLIRLYETNFFEDVSLNLNNNILTINIKENPIIEKIIFK